MSNILDYHKPSHLEVPLTPSLETQSEFLGGLQPSDELSNTNLPFDLTMPPITRASSILNADCLARTYVKLLQILSRNFYEYILSTTTKESPAVFYQHKIEYYIRFLQDPGQRHTSYDRLSTPEAGPNHRIWSDSLFHRLETSFIQAVFESKDSHGVMGRTHQFLAEISVDSRVMSSFLSTMEVSPPLHTLVDTADSYKFALGICACDCHVCRPLPRLLTFEAFIEVFHLHAQSLVRFASIDPHYWWREVGKIIQAWSKAPEKLFSLHNFCHLTVARATVAYYKGDNEPMAHHKDDEFLVLGLRRLKIHLTPC